MAFITGSADLEPLEAFSSILNEKLSISMRRYRYESQRFQELKGEGGQPPTIPSESEMVLAAVLADKSARTLAVAIKAAGGLLVSDLGKQLPAQSQGEVDRAKDALLASGLVISEMVVICRKTQAQTARVPERQTLDEISRLGVVCACGRTYPDERIEEALMVTESVRTLLDGSKWFSLIVLDELLKLT